MEPGTEIVELKLADGSLVKVHATSLGLYEDVLDFRGVIPIEEVLHTIEKLSSAFSDTMNRIKPDKASIEFGIELGVESGAITAFLVKGTGTGNLKISLEWSREQRATGTGEGGQNATKEPSGSNL